jgi:MFS family permease
MITIQPEAAASQRPNPRRGLVFAIAAAGSAAVFLFLPILLLGFTMQTIAAVAGGEILAWRSSVGLTYALLAVPALVSILLLFIPLWLLRAAARLLGPSRATLWVGALLAGTLAGIGVVWLIEGGSRSSPASQTPELWYAIAFGAAAVLILVISLLVARRAAIAALGVVGIATAGLVVLIAMLVAVWDSQPRIPAGAQTVVIATTPTGVELKPARVQPGEVYFIVEGVDDLSGHADVEFITAGYAPGYDHSTTPLPLSGDGLEHLERGDYGGTSAESGFGQYSKWTLLEGNYAFVVLREEGAPQSISVLKVIR